MGELRRLNLEWNDLVTIARDRGMRRVQSQDNNLHWYRLATRAHFQMSRTEARDRVRSLRTSIAPFFAPNASNVQGLDTFGVEIEMHMPRGVNAHDIAQAIRDAGVLCQVEVYGHVTRTHWKIVTDGSLGYSTGREVVSPPLSGEAGLDQVRKVCRVLTAKGCKVKLDCGLHVHIGAQNHQDIGWFKNMLEMTSHFENEIDSFMAPSRRRGGQHANSWCQSVMIRRADFDAAQNLAQLSAACGQPTQHGARSHYRYRKLNLLSFIQSGTIEFRQHQGTVEALKTEMWVRFLLRMSTKAAAIGVETLRQSLAVMHRSLEALLSFLDCSLAERNYFLERRNYFLTRAV
jgi:hypothetical protein